jgi:hypothetical protein
MQKFDAEGSGSAATFVVEHIGDNHFGAFIAKHFCFGCTLTPRTPCNHCYFAV